MPSQIMRVAKWKSETSLFGRSRSDLLKAVDSALWDYESAKNRQNLEAVRDALNAWINKDGGTNRNLATISRLQEQVREALDANELPTPVDTPTEPSTAVEFEELLAEVWTDPEKIRFGQLNSSGLMHEMATAVAKRIQIRSRFLGGTELTSVLGSAQANATLLAQRGPEANAAMKTANMVIQRLFKTVIEFVSMNQALDNSLDLLAKTPNGGIIVALFQQRVASQRVAELGQLSNAAQQCGNITAEIHRIVSDRAVQLRSEADVKVLAQVMKYMFKAVASVGVGELLGELLPADLTSEIIKPDGPAYTNLFNSRLTEHHGTPILANQEWGVGQAIRTLVTKVGVAVNDAVYASDDLDSEIQLLCRFERLLKMAEMIQDAGGEPYDEVELLQTLKLFASPNAANLPPSDYGVIRAMLILTDRIAPVSLNVDGNEIGGSKLGLLKLAYQMGRLRQKRFIRLSMLLSGVRRNRMKIALKKDLARIEPFDLATRQRIAAELNDRIIGREAANPERTRPTEEDRVFDLLEKDTDATEIEAELQLLDVTEDDLAPVREQQVAQLRNNLPADPPPPPAPVHMDAIPIRYT